jgi:cell division protein ZapA
MTALRLLIGGREYDVACDDGQESHLKNLAKTLDSRVRTLSEALGKPSEGQLLMLASLMLTDELHDAKREVEHLRQDIQHSSQSFERNKQIELEGAIALTIHNIADRIETIAGELERV